MTPAERALQARAIADYSVVVRAFHPQPHRRRSQVVPMDARRLREIIDRPVYPPMHLGDPPRRTFDRAWRNVLLLALFAAGLWLALALSGHSPEVFKP